MDGTSSRNRPKKRRRRDVNAGARGGLALLGGYSRGVRSALTEPGMVMKFSTIACATGGVCLVLAVFSGPVLVFLAVLALGMCGMCYSVRQRGALEYLPRGVVDLLTRTTLLEFLTDTSVFDAVKTYLVFMMGLSADETQGVLQSLPEGMRETLTRPGLIHSLPRPVQGLLLPPNLAGEGPRSGGGRRRRRLIGTEGFPGGARDPADSRVIEPARERSIEDAANDASEAEEEAPLGQLVWNPLPGLPPAPDIPPRLRENPEQVARRTERQDPSDGEAGHDDDDDGSTASSDPGSSEQENGPRLEQGSPQGRRASAEEGENRRNRAVDSSLSNLPVAARRQPWDDSPPHARSMSPPAARNRTRNRAASADGMEGAEANGGVPIRPPANAARMASSALPGPAWRRWGAGRLGVPREGGAAGTPVPATGGIVPSAERIVASILQSRVDSAVRAAWNVVDERGVRRAAVGSGIALAAHMAYSERARRQAGSMLRGGLLAALAGTATVCAGLAYLKPGEAVRGEASSNPSDVGRDQPAVTEQPNSGVSNEGSGREGGEGRAETSYSRMRKYRAGLQRWLTALTPSTRNMVRLLGMICVLLAVRKWQLLRRAAIRAAMPRGMYGAPPH